MYEAQASTSTLVNRAGLAGCDQAHPNTSLHKKFGVCIHFCKLELSSKLHFLIKKKSSVTL